MSMAVKSKVLCLQCRYPKKTAKAVIKTRIIDNPIKIGFFLVESVRLFVDSGVFVSDETEVLSTRDVCSSSGSSGVIRYFFVTFRTYHNISLLAFYWYFMPKFYHSFR